MPHVSRRAAVTALPAGAATLAGAGLLGAGSPAAAAYPAILKPTPADRFVDFGTNAEMRWDSVDPRRYLTRQGRLFVRNHTSTPVIDRGSWRLRVFGDGLATARPATDPLTLSWRDLRRLPRTTVLSVHECTGNGRSFFGTQQATPAPGTQWTLGAVGTVAWEGVRLRDLFAELGIAEDAVSVQATGLDPSYVSGGVDYGPVRRPFPVSKALRDAVLAWGANGDDLLPDHGYPLRLVLPGWVGIASIKWLGSLEVSRSVLTSPWNTKWYRMTGPSYAADEAPLTVNPVRSAWELSAGARLRAGRSHTLTGRAWSGAAPIAKVQVSTDGGETWERAELRDETRAVAATGAVRGHGWTRFSHTWDRPRRGAHVLMARATDADGRRQPLTSPYNDQGYFFDAVVRHPVTVR
ncbi:molybdopterin-dependent oxidoreductase [Nocardioides flavescens]|uniref:Molybdopterin-dependent oxidoreductase n=1 Tax=Nocardioides flavescens TaxID=2691959 RepID=A0A6L7EQX2_9ACTN|nr:molybdopterin-dependent oxidoreductase [Nocardioides flavescens]MXG87976.1 molybdopterin-dependent oxidoreductase [Nocardioides flavescens]